MSYRSEAIAAVERLTVFRGKLDAIAADPDGVLDVALEDEEVATAVLDVAVGLINAALSIGEAIDAASKRR
jgi:hypothetical protein